MASDISIRAAVKDMYPNSRWAAKVDKMTDDQVYAIYIKNLDHPHPLQQKERPPEQERLF